MSPTLSLYGTRRIHVLNMRVRGLLRHYPRLIDKHLNDLLNEWNDRNFNGLFHHSLLNPVCAVHRVGAEGSQVPSALPKCLALGQLWLWRECTVQLRT